MVQFYFLSIVLNLVGGYALTVAGTSRPLGFLKNLDETLVNSRSRLALGILSLVTGIFKLLTPMRGDVRVVGDLFPAVIGMLVGLVLLLEIHRGPDKFLGDSPLNGSETGGGEGESKGREPSRQRRFEELLLRSGRRIGMLAMLAGIVHFLFPMELFL